jgi:hypothetical protein
MIARGALLAGAISLSLAAAAEDRVVAVGDIHGSFDGLVAILTRTGIIDSELRWVGGNSTFVQTGDLLDRGLAVREVMDLMIRLQGEAQEAGGQVVVLLGNHETMNMTGILRDVNGDAFATFADADSQRRRSQGWKEFRRFWRNRARRLDRDESLSSEAREQWLALHPPGKLEYAQAMSAEGSYGRWLRSLPLAVVVDGVLFTHGGFGPHLEGMTVDEVNRTAREQIAEFDELRAFMVREGLILPWHSLPEMAGEAQLEIQAALTDGPATRPRELERARRARRLETVMGWQDWIFMHTDGPLWFRGAAQWDEQERGGDLIAILDGLGVRYMVVGHTVQGSGRIRARFDDRVFLIDTGMLAEVYAGRPSALVFENGGVTAVYPDETHELLAPPRPTAAHSPSVTASQP